MKCLILTNIRENHKSKTKNNGKITLGGDNLGFYNILLLL